MLQSPHSNIAGPDPHGSVPYRIRKPDPYPNQIQKPDPDPHQNQNSGAVKLKTEICRAANVHNGGSILSREL